MSTSFPMMITSRLSLKQILAEDVEHVYRGLSHPQVIRYYGVSYQTLEKTEEQMRWYRELESGCWWALRTLKNATFIGAAGFNNLNREHRKAELGFWLLPECWGNGYMSEALKPIIAYGQEIMQLHRIEAFVESENRSSCSTLLKQGFRQEGSLRDSEIKNGQFISVHVFAKISSDKHEFMKA